MKKNYPVLLALLVLVAVSLACSGAGPEQGFVADPLADITTAATALLASLVAIPAFIASGLAIAEYYGVVTQALSDVIQMYVNTGLYILSFIAVLLGKTSLLSMIEHYASGINPILVAFLALIGGATYSIIKTKEFGKALRGLHPVAMKLKSFKEYVSPFGRRERFVGLITPPRLRASQGMR